MQVGLQLLDIIFETAYLVAQVLFSAFRFFQLYFHHFKLRQDCGLAEVVVRISIAQRDCREVGADVGRELTEQREEIEVKCSTYLHQLLRLNRLSFKDSIDVLLRNTNETAKLCLGHLQCVKALFDSLADVYLF